MCEMAAFGRRLVKCSIYFLRYNGVAMHVVKAVLKQWDDSLTES